MTLLVKAMPLQQLRRLFLEEGRPASRADMAGLRSDPRAGAQFIYRLLERRRQRSLAERRRISRLLAMEKRLWADGYECVAGVDEVGVGCMAGPVVAAAVIFPPGTVFEGLNDSKRLDEARRRELLPLIQSRARAVSVGIAEADEIDRVNVYQASILAMQRAVQGLEPSPDFVLVDARELPGLRVAQRAFVKGDCDYFCIAAASIVAKVFRDNLMRAMDSRFPQYGFAQHKGYGTESHRRALKKHGCSPIHRSSYPAVRELAGHFSQAYFSLSQRLTEAEVLDDLAGLSKELQAASLSPAETTRLEKRLRVRKKLLAAQRQPTLF